ncbi:hypothetical protein [Streptomyces sp. NPDC058755]|uniref:hypothetical protein n=1 Tax=Streptomyces sp. NPDC058755 TaxID=3346624 RepID=UPI0036C7E5E1
MLPDRRTDDAALLLARTHAPARHHPADVNVEPDPAQVPRARKFAVDQVDAWRLEEAAIVTELVVSELVTNTARRSGARRPSPNLNRTEIQASEPSPSAWQGAATAPRVGHQPVGRPAMNEVSRSAMTRSSWAE